MTHPYTLVLTAAGVAEDTQNGQPMNAALVVAPVEELTDAKFRNLSSAIVLDWAALGSGPSPQGFEIRTPQGTTVNVAIFNDERHGLCAALGYPMNPEDRHTFAVEFWPVADHEAPLVKVWQADI